METLKLTQHSNNEQVKLFDIPMLPVEWKTANAALELKFRHNALNQFEFLFEILHSFLKKKNDIPDESHSLIDLMLSDTNLLYKMITGLNFPMISTPQLRDHPQIRHVIYDLDRYFKRWLHHVVNSNRSALDVGSSAGQQGITEYVNIDGKIYGELLQDIAKVLGDVRSALPHRSEELTPVMTIVDEKIVYEAPKECLISLRKKMGELNAATTPNSGNKFAGYDAELQEGSQKVEKTINDLFDPIQNESIGEISSSPNHYHTVLMEGYQELMNGARIPVPVDDTMDTT